MKIIYLGDNIMDTITGGERQIKEMLTYLRCMHCDLNIVETKNKKEIIDKLKRYRTQSDGLLMVDYSKRFDYLYICLYAKFKLNYKLILFVGAFYYDYRTSKIKNFIDHIVSYLFLKTGNMVFTTGNSVNNRLKKEANISRNIYSVYPALRESIVKEMTSQSEMDYGKENYSFLVVGRFHPVKGYEYLVRAASLIIRSDFHITIVGDYKRNPDYYHKIIHMIEDLNLKDKFTIYGSIDNDRTLAEMYQKAFVCVHTSVWESSPITLCEALLFGKPVIATNVGGTSEYLTNGIDSLLVPGKNPIELAKAMELLMNDPKLYSELSLHALESRKSFIERTWLAVSKEYYEILNNHFDLTAE